MDSPDVRLRQAHRWLGWAVVVIFLLTGLYLHHHFPDAYATDAAIRYQFRANHLYLLAAGLVHLVLGSYLACPPPGWRRTGQFVGSALLLVAVVLLTVAFFAEPPLARPDRPLTAFGLFALLGGVLAHWPARLRPPKARPGR